MHDDLIDAVEWAVTRAHRPDKVAIMGGSYGGYATLVGLTFTPDVFACGVDIVGPSNLETLLKTIPPYWEARRSQFHKRMGDPTTEDGRSCSGALAAHKADQIKRPLLIGQGANDPRVKQAETEQIVEAMKAKGIPVTYVLFPDEGHGFARPATASPSTRWPRSSSPAASAAARSRSAARWRRRRRRWRKAPAWFRGWLCRRNSRLGLGVGRGCLGDQRLKPLSVGKAGLDPGAFDGVERLRH